MLSDSGYRVWTNHARRKQTCGSLPCFGREMVIFDTRLGTARWVGARPQYDYFFSDFNRIGICLLVGESWRATSSSCLADCVIPAAMYTFASVIL